MLRRALWQARRSGLLAAVVAGVVALSCGGGAERQSVAGPAPVALQPPAAVSDDSGSVGEAAKPVTAPTLCHYNATTKTWSDLSLPTQALSGHLNHGDIAGSCATACPCFPANHGPLTCELPKVITSTCLDAYSLTIGCTVPVTAGTALPPVDPLEFRGAFVSAKQCLWTTDSGEVFQGLSEAEVVACKQIVLASPYYKPGPIYTTCPT